MYIENQCLGKLVINDHMVRSSPDDPRCNSIFHMNYYNDLKKEFSVNLLTRNNC